MERIHPHPLIVDLDTDNVDLKEFKDLDRAKERRLLDDDGVTRLKQDTTSKVDRLGRATSDEDLICVRLDTTFGQALDDKLAQWRIALLVAIFQATRSVVPRETGSLPQSRDRNRFRSRRAVTEVHRILVLFELVENAGPDGVAEDVGSTGEAIAEAAYGCGHNVKNSLPPYGMRRDGSSR